MNKFEKLIEFIINDDDQKARDLFHDIVVEKSRDIYESIMDEESMDETVHGQPVEDMVDEISGEEAMGEDDEEGSEFKLDGDDESGEEPAMHGDEGSAEEHEEIEDKVMNIDAKLDELLAKFDEIMGDDGHGEAPAEEPSDEEFGSEEPAPQEPGMMEGENPFAKSGKSGKSGSGSAASGKSGSAKSGTSGKSGSGKPFESKKSTTELMREYVDKIGDIYGGPGDAAEGDAVGSTGKKTSVNTKDPVGPGANFGGTANLSKGGNADQDGTTPTKASNEYNKGQGVINSGNRNVPGGKAGKPESTGKEYSKEHGAEGQTTDGSVPVAKKSVQAQNTGKK